MQITDQLIQKFLTNRCTSDEAEAVAAYLKENPALLAVYLRPSWEAASGKGILPSGYAAGMLDEIQEGILSARRRTRKRNVRRMLAAAACLMVVTTGWLYYKYEINRVAQHTTIAVCKAGNTKWKVVNNNSDTGYSLTLRDGSQVKLAPGAEIKFLEPFAANDRNISLEGTAFFNATNDKMKPFTVHAGMFSTTALGTSFSVDDNAGAYRVKLFTGKVVIKAIEPGIQGWEQDVFLSPGQQMTWHAGKVTVDKYRTDNRNATSHEDNKATTQKLVFDNTPLQKVMEALQNRYNVPIEYNGDQLKGMYFSGEVLKNDSLSVLMKVIANMNGLQVIEKEQGFIIRRSQ